MPAYVNPDACDGCSALPEALCQYICPNDLMALDKGRMKAFNQEPDMCSECFACVKICPQEAIEVRGYADFVPMGAMAKPKRSKTEITWIVKFRDGRTKYFSFPTRITLPEAIGPYHGFPEAKGEDLRGPCLYGEPRNLGVSQLPVPK